MTLPAADKHRGARRAHSRNQISRCGHLSIVDEQGANLVRRPQKLANGDSAFNDEDGLVRFNPPP
jgi:hypothetical protein